MSAYLAESSGRVGSVECPEMVAVSAVLAPTLRSVTDPYDVFEAVGMALEAGFPGLVTEGDENLSYKKVWCPDIGDWVIVCCDVVEFRVTAGSAVVVPVELRIYL